MALKVVKCMCFGADGFDPQATVGLARKNFNASGGVREEVLCILKRMEKELDRCMASASFASMSLYRSGIFDYSTALTRAKSEYDTAVDCVAGDLDVPTIEAIIGERMDVYDPTSPEEFVWWYDRALAQIASNPQLLIMCDSYREDTQFGAVISAAIHKHLQRNSHETGNEDQDNDQE